MRNHNHGAVLADTLEQFLSAVWHNIDGSVAFRQCAQQGTESQENPRKQSQAAPSNSIIKPYVPRLMP